MTNLFIECLLRSGELATSEFRATKTVLLTSVFETVSAFADTRGGWLVVGVTQGPDDLAVVSASGGNETV